MLNGSRRWLRLGPVSFQPSELAKYAMSVYLARALSQKQRDVTRFFRGLAPLFVLPGIVFMLILMQPNLSTAGSILIVTAVMAMIAGARWRHLGLVGAAGMALGTFYALSEDYRRARLMSFRHPFDFMTNEGYQLSQSLLAFGSGGLFGMGPGMGRQKFAFLPYPESDFIFAVVGEDLGWVGCVAVLALFGAFLFFGLRVAMRCPDRFGAMLAGGITHALRGPFRQPAGRGHHLHDRRAVRAERGRGHRHDAHHGPAAALFQRGRHVHIDTDGRRGGADGYIKGFWGGGTSSVGI